MDREWYNSTLGNGSSPNIETNNTTLHKILPNKNHEGNSIDWAEEKNAMYIIGTVLQCTFLAVGLFGNILTVVVLIYKKWSNIVSKHILLALAVSDTTMLITYTFNQEFIQDLFQLDPRAFSNLGCKIFFLFYRTSKMTSSWFVVFLCVERFIAVTFPLQSKSIVTHRRTKVFILINYLSMAGFNIIQSFSSSVENETCKKDVFASNEKVTFRALALIEMLLFTAIPVVLMSVLTPFILFKLAKHYHKKKALSNNAGKGNEQRKRHLEEFVRTTVILISVVVTFIICLTPVTVFQQLKFWKHIKTQEIENVYSIFMFRKISQFFEQINYSINFFLYILSSSTFRAGVFEIFHIRKTEPLALGRTNLTTKRDRITASTDDQGKPKALESPLISDGTNSLAKDKAVDSTLIPDDKNGLAKDKTVDSNLVPASTNSLAKDEAVVFDFAPASTNDLGTHMAVDSNLVSTNGMQILASTDGLTGHMALDPSLAPTNTIPAPAKHMLLDNNLIPTNTIHLPAITDDQAKDMEMDANLVPT